MSGHNVLKAVVFTALAAASTAVTARPATAQIVPSHPTNFESMANYEKAHPTPPSRPVSFDGQDAVAIGGLAIWTATLLAIRAYHSRDPS